MLEKFSEIAERAATNASRRQFLGRVGRGALAAVAIVGSALARPGIAEAGPKYCGAGSTASCIGKNAGDPCDNGIYGLGVCKSYGRTSCICRSS
jgi:hypothetical protein